ncbi:hypothetical protein J9317_11090 [Metabacillus sp. KIGAM252]|uniref:Threonine dehydratase n=1 Tax=Metabacillus flavus TaxID=2823519 RepID=A0ABS5LEY2_9BACI|nr:hypothetical protein [Metabacillus flavus]MBS2969310.1 hypothetical protein [Metabacillus flavus]
MEYLLKSKSSAIPCLIEADPDSNLYIIRSADTSGQSFNTKEELIRWVEENWNADDFEDPEKLRQAIKSISAY